jgi:murein tripeptide amidase MpaA
MTTEYFAWQLLTKYASDASIRALVDKFDFYITVSLVHLNLMN